MSRLQIALDGVRVVRPVDVLEVRLVDDGEHVARHAFEVLIELVGGVHRPGRIVRVADVDELRARVDRLEQSTELVAMVDQRDERRLGTLLARVDDVARERRPAADDAIARVEDRLADHVDAPVRPGPDADLVARDAVPGGERLVQAVAAAVRVPVQVAGGAVECVERRRERAERPLVRCQLDHPVEAELALHVLDGLPRLVRRQPVDAGPEEGVVEALEPARHVAGPYPSTSELPDGTGCRQRASTRAPLGSA